jgi:5'-nucleotidase
MRILLTNDDGIHAPGLAALEAIAAALSDDIWIVAPAEEQSGAGHSLTLSQPVRLREVGPRRYSVRGTPTDCVMLALGAVLEDHKPDLILSGVNRGGNLAEDVTYSGTVSAAMEGCLAGIRSIALSQVMMDYTAGQEDFRTATVHGAAIIRHVQQIVWPQGVLININFPPVPAEDVRGVRVTEQGFRDYGNIHLVKRTDPRGFPYYWHGFGKEKPTPGHKTDLEAMHEACISVTPLHLDMTHRESLGALRMALSALAAR